MRCATATPARRIASELLSAASAVHAHVANALAEFFVFLLRLQRLLALKPAGCCGVKSWQRRSKSGGFGRKECVQWKGASQLGSHEPNAWCRGGASHLRRSRGSGFHSGDCGFHCALRENPRAFGVRLWGITWVSSVHAYLTRVVISIVSPLRKGTGVCIGLTRRLVLF